MTRDERQQQRQRLLADHDVMAVRYRERLDAARAIADTPAREAAMAAAARDALDTMVAINRAVLALAKP